MYHHFCSVRAINENTALLFVELSAHLEFDSNLNAYFNKGITNCIIGFSLNEFCYRGVDVQSLLKKSCDILTVWFPNLKNLCVLHIPCVHVIPWKHPQYNIDIIPFDLFLVKTPDPSQLQGITKRSSKLGNGKAMAIFGDSVNRPHKLGFVQYADSVGKLDMFDYSMTHRFHGLGSTDEENANLNTLNFVQTDLTPAESYLKYSKTFENDVALDYFDSCQASVFETCYTHYPDLINHTSLIFVVETNFHLPYNCVTEKSWKPFVAKLPFVSMTYNDLTYQYLESLGFRTFTKYTEIPIPQVYLKGQSYHYPHSENVSGHDMPREFHQFYFDIALNRVENFLNNMHKYQDQIQEDIEHNSAQLKKLRNEEIQKLYQSPIFSSIDPFYFVENNLYNYNS